MKKLLLYDIKNLIKMKMICKDSEGFIPIIRTVFSTGRQRNISSFIKTLTAKFKM